MKKSGAEEERREYRRKRKQRNQLFAYILLFMMVIAMGIGIVAGVKAVVGKEAEQEAAKESSQEVIEDLFASEESIQVPEESDEVVEMAPEEKLDLFIEEQIAQMPLNEKVAGLFFVTPESITGVNTAVQAGDGTKAALEE